VSLVAIDTEWYDNDNGDDTNENTSSLSTIQIAAVLNDTANSSNDTTSHTNHMSWVIDLCVADEDYKHMCQLLIIFLFTKVVLGFSFSNDLRRLETYCQQPLQQLSSLLSSSSSSLTCATSTVPSRNDTANDAYGSNILDLQLLWSPTSQLPGLACCVQEFCSSTKSLSKEYQCSNWSHRPLSTAQLQYAGLDAVIVLYLLSEKYRVQEVHDKRTG
jgi:3'-5' exonuclease